MLLHSIFRIIESVGSIAQNIPLTGGEASIIRTKIAIMAQEISAENFTGLSFGVALNSNGNLDGDSLTGDGERTGSINVPEDLLDGVEIIGNARVAFGTYTDDTLFVQATVRREPATIIMTLDVFSEEGKVEVDNLENPVILTYIVPGSIQISSLVCAFWNSSEFSHCILHSCQLFQNQFRDTQKS